MMRTAWRGFNFCFVRHRHAPVRVSLSFRSFAMRYRSIVAGLVTAVALIVSLNSVTRADVLVSNLDEPFNFDTPIGLMGPDYYWGAQSFYSGVDNYTLTSIDAIVGNGMNSPSVVAQLRRSDIMGDIDNTLGGLITTFTAPDMTGMTSIRTFLPDVSVNLVSTEKYWFILGSDNAGTYDWSYAEGPMTIGPGALSNYADSIDAGVTWINRDSIDPYFIRVNASSVVPEPSGLLPAGLIATALIGLIRRRRSLNCLD
jgi:hypothetical protein